MNNLKDKLYPPYHRDIVETKIKMRQRYSLSEIHNKAVAVLDFTSFRQGLIYLTKVSCNRLKAVLIKKMNKKRKELIERFNPEKNITTPKRRGFNVPHIIIPGVEPAIKRGPIRPNTTQRMNKNDTNEAGSN